MADEHGTHEHGVHPTGDQGTPDPPPGPTADAVPDPRAPGTRSPGPLIPGPQGGGALLRTAPAEPRVPKPDVKNSVVLALAVTILAFTAISGVSIWAAARFDGGIPGITAPADHHRLPPVDRPAPDSTRLTPDRGAAPGTPPDSPAPAAHPIDGNPVTGNSVDWNSVAYPLDCAGLPADVKATRPVPPAALGIYLVQVRCDTGAGSAPDALYSYGVGQDGRPRLRHTLIDTADDRLVQSIGITDGHATAVVLGYTSDDVPRCCPDDTQTVELLP